MDLTRNALARADKLDGSLGVYLARFDDYALEAAGRADAELAQGRDRGPLHGIPCAIKDILAMAEGPTTAQSLVLDRAWGGAGRARGDPAQAGRGGADRQGLDDGVRCRDARRDQAVPAPA